MIKWFLYIVLLMISAPRLSSAKSITASPGNFLGGYHIPMRAGFTLQRDTTVTKSGKHSSEEDKKKIKEVAKAKKMPKPVKVEEPVATKPKPKRQRRPDGLERPPEIPRRNNN